MSTINSFLGDTFREKRETRPRTIVYGDGFSWTYACSEVVEEVVEHGEIVNKSVEQERCEYCGTLRKNSETKCPSCGANF